MAQAAGVYASKTSWQLQLDFSEGTLDAANNRSFVNWALYMYRGNSDTPWNNSASGWTVNGPGGTSSAFGAYRFGGTGTGTNYSGTGVGGRVLIASGGDWVTHNPDGSGSTAMNASHAAGSTLGSAATNTPGLTLTTLKVLPGTPTGLTATYVSDTQVDLAWSQSSASNGQPVTNKIQKRVNGGAWTDVATVSATTTATVTVAANQKIEFQVLATNAAGSTAYSAASAPVYTTPGAPTSLVAVKSGADISLTFVENVAYSEYEHEILHGTITGGVTTWDGAPLTTLATGVLAYTHVAPSAAAVHVYQARAKAGARLSTYTLSNSVQLLTAPAKPTIPALPAFADKASIFRFPWVHNSIDSSAQTKRQVRYSTNGGTTWTTGAKTADVNAYLDFAANTWAANAAVTFQVRTKGAYDSGADGDASYSPWSDSVTVTFKTVPVATITAPANASVYTESALSVNLGFAQSEAATFVKAQLELLQGATLLEAKETVTLLGTVMATPVANGGAYTIRARVLDSNGIWSAWASNAFTVTYLSPVPAGVVVSYLPDTGWGQLDLSIPAPGGGQAAATTVTVTRTILGVEETVVSNYPVAALLTFLDTIPTVHGTNSYKITTKSAIGATSVTLIDLVTAELRRAYLSKGAGYANVGTFGGNLVVSESLSVASDTMEAAGRIKPIGLYGVETSVQLKVQSFVFEGFGSTVDQMRGILLIPGKACYRDSSGRRVFGTAKGGLTYKKVGRANLSFTMTETS